MSNRFAYVEDSKRTREKEIAIQPPEAWISERDVKNEVISDVHLVLSSAGEVEESREVEGLTESHMALPAKPWDSLHHGGRDVGNERDERNKLHAAPPMRSEVLASFEGDNRVLGKGVSGQYRVHNLFLGHGSEVEVRSQGATPHK